MDEMKIPFGRGNFFDDWGWVPICFLIFLAPSINGTAGH